MPLAPLPAALPLVPVAVDELLPAPAVVLALDPPDMSAIALVRM
jgi:hypothetical protein